MSPEDRAQRLVDEAVLWVPALKSKHTPETRLARRRFDHHMKALSDEMGFSAMERLRLHLVLVVAARERLAELPASGEAGKQP